MPPVSTFWMLMLLLLAQDNKKAMAAVFFLIPQWLIFWATVEKLTLFKATN